MKASVFASTALATVVCWFAITTESRSAGTESTSDGVFDVPQAVRGKNAYLQNCSAGCHTSKLTGGERAPALAGDLFLQQWKGQTLDDLFRRIRTTMPQQKPQSLSDQAYIDIVAFLLQANAFAPGDHELPSDSAKLSRILIGDTEP